MLGLYIIGLYIIRPIYFRPIYYGRPIYYARPIYYTLSTEAPQVSAISDRRVRCGEDATFVTSCTGTPYPGIKWLLGDKDVDTVAECLTYREDCKHFLLIRKCQTEHSGDLTVIAHNDVGPSTQTATLYVGGTK